MSQDVRISEVPEADSGGSFARAHRILVYSLSAVVVIWLLSGFYQVRADQVAIVERLGEYIATPEGKPIQLSQGLHYHLPWPIDSVQLISTQQSMTLDVTAFNTSPSEYDEFKQADIKRLQAAGAQPNPDLMSAIY